MLCRYILYKYSVLCRQFLTWTGKTASVSDESELFHLCLKHVGPWPCRAAFPGEPDYLGDIRIPEGGQAGHVVRTQPFQQVVEVAPVVMVSQMCHLMQQDIVAYGFRKPYEVEIEVQLPQLETLCLMVTVPYLNPYLEASRANLAGSRVLASSRSIFSSAFLRISERASLPSAGALSG